MAKQQGSITSHPPEPDWVALRSSLADYYTDRMDPVARDLAFGHVYQALRYLARLVVAKRLHPAQGSITNIAEGLVDKVFFRKTFTNLAGSFDPEKGTSFKTWATTVLTNLFFDWCDTQKGQPHVLPLESNDAEELESEWNKAIHDIVDSDFDGGKRPGVVSQLIEAENERSKEQAEARLRAAIESLPELLRKIVSVDDKVETQKQASERLGISLASFKRKRQLALDYLKRALV